jgi:tryptophan halogenase
VTRPAATYERARRLVIAGGGLTAWLTAAVLARSVSGEDFSITVVGADGGEDCLEPFGVADATLPWAERHHSALDLDEERIVAATGGTFSFGIALSGWAEPGSSYFQPFSSLGAPLGPVSFHHLALRLRREGVPVRLANFAVAALAAQAGRFARPGPDPRSVLSTCQYGLNLDVEQLAAQSRVEAGRAGVETVRGILGPIERGANGQITALTTSGGTRVPGDLFLDCTGVEGRLIGDAVDVGWDDWSAWLPCDRVMSAVSAAAEDPAPYSHVEAHRAGWIRHLPLQGRGVFTGLFHTAAMDDQQALAGLRAVAGGGELRHLQARFVRFGRRRKLWHQNCVALGTAGCLIDPVGVTNMQLLRLGLDRLLGLLPGNPACVAEAAEYNRRLTAQLDHARDFALAHYKLNGRSGEPFWDACRATPAPDSLQYKLELFASRGRVALYDEEPVDEVSWINLLDEQGVEPRRYSPLADGFSKADLQAHLQRVRKVMIDAVGGLPRHADYLAQVSAQLQSARRAVGETGRMATDNDETVEVGA